MVGHHSKESDARADLPQVDPAPGQDRAAGAGTSAESAAEVELALADLVGDANGEVVIFNDSGVRTLALHTGAAVVANGTAQAHVTAGGEDVTGFRYVTFETGVTVYFQEGLNLILDK